jgi:poly-gamma-glutamate capsule biosynthesis protein CapA/YwtB (metallophosphatase superfamily)
MINITAVGDINLGGNFLLHAKNQDGALRRLRRFREYLPSSDVVFANLEGPLSSHGPFFDGSIHITNPEWCPSVLADLGFNVVSLANNHIMDFGESGLRDTVYACQGKLTVTGAGLNLSEAQQPAAVVARDGTKVCVIAMADEWPDAKHLIASHKRPGYWSIYDANVAEVISEFTAEFDVVIAYIHWGLLNLYHPKPDHRRFAHRLIDLGIPLVIGSHCHHIQGYEKVNNGLIAYGLGDLCFPRTIGNDLYLDPGESGRNSLVLSATIDKGKLVAFSFCPWRFDDSEGLNPLGGKMAKAVSNEHRQLSKGFSSSNYDRWFEFYNSRQNGRVAIGRS